MRWLVGTIQVPIGRGIELGLELIRACRHVETNNQPIFFDERVAGNRSLNLITSEQVEIQSEFLRQFLLPLLDQTTRRDNHTTFQIAANEQFLDQQTRHNGLAGAGIVGQQKP